MIRLHINRISVAKSLSAYNVHIYEQVNFFSRAKMCEFREFNIIINIIIVIIIVIL